MNAVNGYNIWLFLELLARRKRLIFGLVIIVTAIAVVVSLLLPKWFSAKVVLLPPKSISVPIAGGESESYSSAFSITTGLNLPIRATMSDVYVRLLQSRSVTARIIDRFNLAERYGTSCFEETLLALMDHADIRVSDEGLLELSVEDRDPQMAAEIANAFIEELETVNNQIVADRISKAKDFLSGRLEQVRAEMDASREALEAFQMRYKAVDFDEQTRLAIEQAIALRVKLAEIEFDSRLSALTLGQDNVEMIKVNRRRDIIKRQLRQLETENTDSSFFSLPVSAIPGLKGQYEVLYSRVRVAEDLYQILLQQNEQAKIKEFENLPTVSVLDSAEVPSLRSRPQRTLIVGSAFGLSLIFAVLLAAVAEYSSRLKQTNPQDYLRLMMFVDSFFGWLPGVKRRTHSIPTHDNPDRVKDIIKE